MSSSMSSRERVLATLQHQETDRVPINYSANPGIDTRLKAHFSLGPRDSEGLRQRLGVDFARSPVDMPARAYTRSCLTGASIRSGVDVPAGSNTSRVAIGITATSHCAMPTKGQLPTGHPLRPMTTTTTRWWQRHDASVNSEWLSSMAIRDSVISSTATG